MVDAPGRPAPLETVAPPKQARSERTLHRILDAAERLIADRGLAEVSVPEIVREAGSSVGGFYARFRDKQELLRALEERFLQDQRRRLDRLTRTETWGDQPLPDIVRASTRELVQVFEEHDALIRAFVARAVQDAEVRTEAVRFREEIVERYGVFLLGWSDRFHHPDPARALDVGIGVVIGALIARVLFAGAAGPFSGLSPDDVAEELARNLLGYLGVPSD